jgi:hypothetical protein
MKKIFSILTLSATMLLSSCGGLTGMGTSNQGGTDILGGIIGAATDGETISNIIYNVIGLSKLNEQDLYGTWSYESPGCAFTSDKLLAQAGGEVAAKRIEDELQQTYTKLGINGGNTSFTFNQDKTFSANIGGKKISGTYVYNKSDSSIKFKTLLLSTTGYVTRNAKGVSLVFESKKLLSVLQMLASVSGNSTLSTIGDLSKNYDGVRLGFDLRR